MMYKKQLWRFLEILPGTISWTIIVLPVFLGAYLPVYLAYFMIAFDFYWLIKAIMMGGYLISAYLHMKRDGKMWIRIFPDKPVTKKPLETRMGKGKGAVDHFVAVVRPGTILFEMDGVKISFEKGVLDFIVEKAMEFKLGARGLRSICEAIMMDLMFDTPSDASVKEVSLSLRYAKDKLKKSTLNKLKVA